MGAKGAQIRYVSSHANRCGSNNYLCDLADEFDTYFAQEV
jgi:hypothetical protein